MSDNCYNFYIRRELGNGVVRVGPYFLAKTLAELPFYLIYPTLYIIVAYLLIGYTLNTVSNLRMYVACVLTPSKERERGRDDGMVIELLEVAT